MDLAMDLAESDLAILDGTVCQTLPKEHFR